MDKRILKLVAYQKLTGDTNGSLYFTYNGADYMLCIRQVEYTPNRNFFIVKIDEDLNYSYDNGIGNEFEDYSGIEDLKKYIDKIGFDYPVYNGSTVPSIIKNMHRKNKEDVIL